MRSPLLALTLVAAGGVCGACGGRSPGGSVDAAEPSPDADPLAPDAAPPDPPDAGPSFDGSAACETQIAPIGAEMYTTIGSCTVVVRLEFQSFSPIGWQLVCAPYGLVDEPTARANAQGDTGFGSTANLLSPAPPSDEWVFHIAPSDFGGAAAVSARTGRTVFGGSIVWDGAGDIVYPTEWRAPPTLGCADQGPIQATGYDLENAGPVSPDDVDAALSAVRSTPFPAALWTGGYVFDAVVLRYPRTVGEFNPTTAEWVVLLNGGWLE
jgi:hypothetical protein